MEFNEYRGKMKRNLNQNDKVLKLFFNLDTNVYTDRTLLNYQFFR